MTTGIDTGYEYTKLITCAGDAGATGSQSYSNFRLNFGQNMQKIKRVSVVSVSFPNSAYNINEGIAIGNNSWATVHNSVTNDYAVEPGWYTTANLMDIMSVVINAQTADGSTVTLAQDQYSNKVYLSYSAGTSGVTSITMADSYPTTGGGGSFLTSAGHVPGLWEVLGFANLPITVQDGHISTATYLPSLGGLHTAYLQSSALAPGNMFDQDDIKNTLLVIPITAPFGGENVFECKVDRLCDLTYTTPRNLQQIDFYLTDRYGNVIDLHGGNLIINLKCWFNKF